MSSALSPPRRRLRDSSSWWYPHADGTTELVVIRRVGRDQALGGWHELRFHRDTEAACEAAYTRYCEESYENAVRQAEKRKRWGPL